MIKGIIILKAERTKFELMRSFSNMAVYISNGTFLECILQFLCKHTLCYIHSLFKHEKSVPRPFCYMTAHSLAIRQIIFVVCGQYIFQRVTLRTIGHWLRGSPTYNIVRRLISQQGVTAAKLALTSAKLV